MINVLGENYYIDLDEVEKYLEFSSEVGAFTGETEQKVNLIKFDLIKLLLETVLTEGDDGFDEKLGIKSATKTTIPFRLAFNSLLNKKLINHY